MKVDVIGDVGGTEDCCGTLAADWPTSFRPMGLREIDGPFIFAAMDHETESRDERHGCEARLYTRPAEAASA